MRLTGRSDFQPNTVQAEWETNVRAVEETAGAAQGRLTEDAVDGGRGDLQIGVIIPGHTEFVRDPRRYD